MKKVVNRVKAIANDEYLFEDIKLRKIDDITNLNVGSDVYIDLHNDGVLAMQQYRYRVNEETELQYRQYVHGFIGYFIRQGQLYTPVSKHIISI